MRFRVLSDLHVDYNDRYPLEIPENGRDVFTVLCGDTSGGPETTIDWVKKNVRHGVLVSGNHLPYCNHREFPVLKKRTMDELREVLADAFPPDGDITYLDAETGTVKKAVDGVLFLGSCCYTDMRISHETLNPNGDQALNRRCSEFNMNDYRYGYVRREWPFGSDNDPRLTRMTAGDYEKWFANALSAFDCALSENEKSESPMPVVLVTHHPLLPVFLTHSYYVDDCSNTWSWREFNWASYASDLREWMESHPSIKCYCCGHIHAVEKKWRNFKMNRANGGDILVVSNTRGYVEYGHDYDFNINTFVDTETWNVVEEPLSEKDVAERKAMAEKLMRCSAWLM